MTNLSLQEEEILEAAIGNEFIKIRSIARKTRFGYDTCKEVLRELYLAGKVARKRLTDRWDGSGGYGYRTPASALGEAEEQGTMWE